MTSTSKKRKRAERSNEPTIRQSAAQKRVKRAPYVTGRQITRKQQTTTTRGLPRPRTTLSFSAPSRDNRSSVSGSLLEAGDQSVSAAPDAAQSSINQLRDIIHIISLIVRRNKNQHRSQPFWKHLCMLYRCLKKLLSLHERIAASQSSSSSFFRAERPSAEDVRRRFEAESRLRGEKEVIEEHVRENLVPECYVRFSSVVSDSQFANLGLVLMGILADVADVVGVTMMQRNLSEEQQRWRPVKTSTAKNQHRNPRDSPASIVGTSVRVTGEEQGEIVQHTYGTPPLGFTAEESDDEGNDFGMVVRRETITGSEQQQQQRRQPALQESLEDETSVHARRHGRISSPKRSSDARKHDKSARSSSLAIEAEAALETIEGPVHAGPSQKKDVPSTSRSEPRTVATSSTKAKSRSGSNKKKKGKKGGAFDNLFKDLV